MLRRSSDQADGEANQQQRRADDHAGQGAQQRHFVRRPAAAEGERQLAVAADQCPRVVGVDGQVFVAARGLAQHIEQAEDVE
jgi:hypothetical protein